MHISFFLSVFLSKFALIVRLGFLMLEELKANIDRLVALYESEKQRADGLAALLSEREDKLKSCKEQITDLNQQIDNLKLRSAFLGGGDTVLAKENISALIGEIDKCIKLLEK